MANGFLRIFDHLVFLTSLIKTYSMCHKMVTKRTQCRIMARAASSGGRAVFLRLETTGALVTIFYNPNMIKKQAK
ncbi:hypothetical protein A6M21_16120 [Desulfotomaculum copahuensis]|uniref:Uncharacterized protein n=1 Tax=Desulfotomaculum copahuensis TaxID=1838280 RepID=A0A1B7LAK6_9FIRM|nr:hypothetical protein A6M21_16120 [Desulfotomaculum copahuensis]